MHISSTALPQFMRVYNNGDLLMSGVYDNGMYPNTPAHTPPVEGAGHRMMWMPERAAFRAGGLVDEPYWGGGTSWDTYNIGYYSTAMGYNTMASGDYSTALGRFCRSYALSSFSVGENCTASGAASVAMGYHAHTNARQGSFVFADRSTTDTLRAGVNHSANWRVSGGFRIFTSSGLYTGVTIQSGAVTSNWSQDNAVISTSTGAMLSTGGVWQNASDVNKKHLFENISGEDILSRLRRIPIREWSYKTEEDNVRHLGPTAQDFKAAFGLGTDDKSIGTVDADGVALASVQALDNRTREQAQEINTLKTENELLQARLTALEQRSGPVSKGALPIALILLLIIAGVGTLYRRKTSPISPK